MKPDEKYARVADELREWIDVRSKELGIPATELHPVYSAHVLLCSLIEELAGPAGRRAPNWQFDICPCTTVTGGKVAANPKCHMHGHLAASPERSEP